MPYSFEDYVAKALNYQNQPVGLVYAQLATATAIREQTEQLHVANLLALGQARINPSSTPPFSNFVFEPVDEYTVQPTEPIRKTFGLPDLHKKEADS